MGHNVATQLPFFTSSFTFSHFGFKCSILGQMMIFFLIAAVDDHYFQSPSFLYFVDE